MTFVVKNLHSATLKQLKPAGSAGSSKTKTGSGTLRSKFLFIFSFFTRMFLGNGSLMTKPQNKVENV